MEVYEVHFPKLYSLIQKLRNVWREYAVSILLQPRVNVRGGSLFPLLTGSVTVSGTWPGRTWQQPRSPRPAAAGAAFASSPKKWGLLWTKEVLLLNHPQSRFVNHPIALSSFATFFLMVVKLFAVSVCFAEVLLLDKKLAVVLMSSVLFLQQFRFHLLSADRAAN